MKFRKEATHAVFGGPIYYKIIDEECVKFNKKTGKEEIGDLVVAVNVYGYHADLFTHSFALYSALANLIGYLASPDDYPLEIEDCIEKGRIAIDLARGIRKDGDVE